MATSMLKKLGSNKIPRFCRFSDFYRTFLSKDYQCNMLWRQRLKSKYLETIEIKPFGVQLLENFDTTKTLHPVDVDLFVNKMQELTPKFYYLIRDIIHRYRHCNSSIPVQDHIMHAIVRGHMDLNQIESLMAMLKDKSKYGIFPDHHAMCLLLDHFISKQCYADAAQLAYDVMLQEVYDNQLLNVLSLNAAVKHFTHTLNLERPEPEKAEVDEEVEIEYIAVKVIRNPYYDDHFDIKDDRFLLGKTMYYLSRNTHFINDTLSRSLQLIGLGLYEKFERANKHLEEWISSGDKHVVYNEALNHYNQFLRSAPTRDPDAKPKSMGDKTIDDEIELLKLTPNSKEKCLAKLKSLMSSLDEGRLPSLNIVDQIDACMSGPKFEKLERDETSALIKKYIQWMKNRDINVKGYLAQTSRQKKAEEIQEKLSSLQEREELLTYFINRKEIETISSKCPPEVDVKVVKEEYVEAPGDRVVKAAVKRKKKN